MFEKVVRGAFAAAALVASVAGLIWALAQTQVVVNVGDGVVYREDTLRRTAYACSYRVLLEPRCRRVVYRSAEEERLRREWQAGRMTVEQQELYEEALRRGLTN